jgi:hypothetical protein
MLEGDQNNNQNQKWKVEAQGQFSQELRVEGRVDFSKLDFTKVNFQILKNVQSVLLSNMIPNTVSNMIPEAMPSITISLPENFLSDVLNVSKEPDSMPITRPNLWRNSNDLFGLESKDFSDYEDCLAQNFISLSSEVKEKSMSVQFLLRSTNYLVWEKATPDLMEVQLYNDLYSFTLSKLNSKEQEVLKILIAISLKRYSPESLFGGVPVGELNSEINADGEEIENQLLNPNKKIYKEFNGDGKSDEPTSPFPVAVNFSSEEKHQGVEQIIPEQVLDIKERLSEMKKQLEAKIESFGEQYQNQPNEEQNALGLPDHDDGSHLLVQDPDVQHQTNHEL